MTRVLNCGSHEGLHALRHRVLESVPDCEVVSLTPEHAVEVLACKNFDVLVLCYQMSNEFADAICIKFRHANPAGRVVAIVGVPWTRMCEADITVDAHKPSALTAAVASYPEACSTFKHGRRLSFSDDATWAGWSCDRCCWHLPRKPGIADHKIQAEFDRHSCEAFARETWQSETAAPTDNE